MGRESIAKLTIAGEPSEIVVPTDSERDAAAPINDALQVLADNGGGELVLPAGTFWCKRTVVIPAGCSLRGSGPGTVLKAAPGLDAGVIANESGATGCQVLNLIVDGNRANQTSGNGIHLTSCDDAVIGAVSVQNCYADGILLANCARPILAGAVALSNGTHGLHLSGTTFANGSVTARDNGQNASGDAVYLDATATDNVLSVSATDTRASGSKTQLYGVVEAASSGCDRNVFTAGLAGNATGTASLIGVSSKLTNMAALVASGVNPQDVTTAASAGTATTAAPVDHVHTLAAGAVGNAALASGIDGAKLVASSVANAALASGIDGGKLSVGTVQDAAILAVSGSKVGSGINGANINAGSVDGSRMASQNALWQYIASAVDYTIPAWGYMVIMNGGFNVYLPAPSVLGLIVVKKWDTTATPVVIHAAGGALIDGVATFTLFAQFDSVTLTSDGGSYFVI